MNVCVQLCEYEHDIPAFTETFLKMHNWKVNKTLRQKLRKHTYVKKNYITKAFIRQQSADLFLFKLAPKDVILRNFRILGTHSLLIGDDGCSFNVSSAVVVDAVFTPLRPRSSSSCRSLSSSPPVWTNSRSAGAAASSTTLTWERGKTWDQTWECSFLLRRLLATS